MRCSLGRGTGARSAPFGRPGRQPLHELQRGAYRASIPLLVLLLLLGAMFIKSAHLQLAATAQAVVSTLALLLVALVFAAASWACLKRYQQSGYCLADERAASQISVLSVLALELMAFGLAVVGILTRAC